ncbi:MarR family winged helix-turn-helix transcriptional regulator [Hydrogenophaga sp.]|uniref:MarR family winged helix-turn-helix transcriptional regulator n=1 Tax=Hydrogenophaga sp. TaxID=1904254 RepID=UPI00271B19CA|nr:MarR family transcriptional regulator [Hydrogenophaga sp.]MDO9604456.1 MarR family transcriptional regulator [Hydrogenophaga sp.]
MTSKSIETQNLLHHWRESVPHDRLAHLVRDVARAQMRALQYRLSPFGVSFGHWTFLRILWNRDGLTQKELSDLAGVMEPTTFTAVKAMERMGFIERRHLPGNKKNMHVYLTDTGRSLEHVLVPLAEEVNDISADGLPDRTLSLVRNALVRMIENLAQEEETRATRERDAGI